jgi:hypothetical protein
VSDTETATEAWPLRYRLHGGRKTHIAYVVQGDEGDYRLTACQRRIEDADNQLPAGTNTELCDACTHRLRRPHVGDPRQHTPDTKIINAEGRAVTTVRLKRCCNGCDQQLGDADNRDVTRGGDLVDVRAECPTCKDAADA